MNTVQFDTIVSDGVLEIPAQFRGTLEGKVHVTVSKPVPGPKKNGLRELLDNPLKIPDFVPLTRDEANED